MTNDFQLDVFLSHSAKNKTIENPLPERLQIACLKVMFTIQPWANRIGRNGGSAE